MDDLIKDYKEAIRCISELIKKYTPEAKKRGCSKKIIIARAKVKEFRMIKLDLEESLAYLQEYADIKHKGDIE